MCTALGYVSNGLYFGRNLDVESSYGESIVITPRNYSPKKDICTPFLHYAVIGMAKVENSYPLYFDGANEKGLCMAGLRFKDTKYSDYKSHPDGICSYEVIFATLTSCKNTEEARAFLDGKIVTDKPFSGNIPPSPLHWIVCDKNSSIAVECEGGKLKTYENKHFVLTNMPSFDIQIFNLNNYINISTGHGLNRFTEHTDLDVYSRGMGAIGLPGDFSSMSRFVRGVFLSSNCTKYKTASENIEQMFHLVGLVSQPHGLTITEDGQKEYTLYSSVIDAENLVYYYKTYYNSDIHGVSLQNENPDSQNLVIYELMKRKSFDIQS